MQLSEAPDILNYRRSARQDVASWAMLIVGAVFVFAAAAVDPSSNCDEAGNCAPWLVYLARILGLIFAAYGARLIFLNPNRGSQIDAASGDFVWWLDRKGANGGKVGRINPKDIARIRIAKQEESGDGLHIYDRNGKRFFPFEYRVVPDDKEGWAMAMVERWPHITLDIV